MKQFKHIFFLCLCVASFVSHAQIVQVQLYGDTVLYHSILSAEKNKAPQTLNFSEAIKQLKDNLELIQAKGYLEAEYDSINYSEHSIHARFSAGKKWTWLQLKKGNVPDLLLNHLGFDEASITNKPVHYSLVVSLFEKIIRYNENKGYPFCSVKLDSVEMTDEAQIKARLNMDRGPLIRIDSIRLSEEDSLLTNPRVVEQITGIKLGELYNEEKLLKLSERIRQSEILEELSPWQFYFNAGQSRLLMNLKEKSRNRADLLLGLLPNNADRGGKLLLTGDAKVVLHNALHQAEKINVNWQNLQYKSPRFNAEFLFPFVLGSPWGVQARFDYFRRDTLFQTADYTIGMQYNLNGPQQFLKLFYNKAVSRLINVNREQVLNSLKLPTQIDYKASTYGMQFNFNKTNNTLVPTQGYLIVAQASLSSRNIIRNTAIESIYDPNQNRNLSYLYDSLDNNKLRYQIQLKLEKYFSLSQYFSVKVSNTAAMVYNKNLFKNELFQIGGFRLMRGYDEAALFVRAYSVSSVEPRYLFSKNSFVYLFADYGILDFNEASSKNALGIGSGVNIETRGGLFNVSYALGNNFGSGIEVRNSKIHFGYLSVF